MPRDCSLCTQQDDYGCGVSDFTEVRFASFLSGGFITAIVVNLPGRKLVKRTSVNWSDPLIVGNLSTALAE